MILTRRQSSNKATSGKEGNLRKATGSTEDIIKRILSTFERFGYPDKPVE